MNVIRIIRVRQTIRPKFYTGQEMDRDCPCVSRRAKFIEGPPVKRHKEEVKRESKGSFVDSW